MRLVQITLPDQVATELDTLKQTGWFSDENEIFQMALMDFARLNRFGLTEAYRRDVLRLPDLPGPTLQPGTS